MSDSIKNTNTAGHGSFERRDIGAKGVLYFLLGLAVVTLLIVLLLMGMFDFLDKREKAQQPAVNPLATNVPADTRKLLPEYKTDAESKDYEKYLKQNFPAPQLEIDERSQLNEDRLREEETLNSYGWADEKAGTVHIPIERAMDLVVQRGLPTYTQDSATQASAAKLGKRKGNKQ